MDSEENLEALVRALTEFPEIDAIGLSSDPVPRRPQDGDIDLFAYAALPPSRDARERLYARHPEFEARRVGVFSNDQWGEGDYVRLDGVDTWIMYFVNESVERDFAEALAGNRCLRENGFYPSGRLAMFRTMRILLERKPILTGFKARLKDYPAALGAAILGHCREIMLDEEDLSRAVERRDILFFHAALDDSLDAILQYLFALNRTLFPGRKRNLEIAANFRRKPALFEDRIRGIVANGSRPETLGLAFGDFKALRDELLDLPA